jgi:hypothetical protein
MKYTKPEVNTLGEARTVIETILQKPHQTPFESPTKQVSAAYDLDE